LTRTFLVLVTVDLGHGVYRKLYTLIGGQRAEKLVTTGLDKQLKDLQLGELRKRSLSQMPLEGIEY